MERSPLQYPFKAKNLLLSAFMERGMDEQEEILNQRCHFMIQRALLVLILVHFQLVVKDTSHDLEKYSLSDGGDGWPL